MMCADVVMPDSSPPPSPCDSSPGSPVLGGITTGASHIPPSRHKRAIHRSSHDEPQKRNCDAYDAPLTCSGAVHLFASAATPCCPQLAAIFSQSRNSAPLTCRVIRPLLARDGLSHQLLTSCQSLDQLRLATQSAASLSADTQLQLIHCAAFSWAPKLHDCVRCHGDSLAKSWRQAAELQLFRLAARLSSSPPLHLAAPGPVAEALNGSQTHWHTWLLLFVTIVSVLQLLASLTDYSRCQQAAPPSLPWLPAETTQLWRSLAHLLVWHLLVRSARRARTLPLHQWPHTSACSCNCERDAWLVLVVVFRRASLDFRREMAAVFEFILTGRRIAVDGLGSVPEELYPTEQPTCQHIHVWMTWVLLSLSDVLRLSDSAPYVFPTDRSDHLTSASSSADVSSQPLGYPLVVSLTDTVLHKELPASAMASDSVGACVSCQLLLVARFVDAWGGCERVPLLLWQHLWRLLTPQHTEASDARRSGSSRSGAASHLARLTSSPVPSSASEWLSACRQQPCSSGSLAAHVCSLLRVYLTPSVAASVSGVSSEQATRSWRAVAGRVLLKLHARKALEMSTAALVDCVSVLLTLLQTGDDQRLPGKLTAFLALLLTPPGTAGSCGERGALAAIAAVRAHFAAIRVLLQRRPPNASVSALVSTLAAHLDKIMRTGAAHIAATCTKIVAAFLDECAALLSDAGVCDTACLPPHELFDLYTDGWRVWLLASGSAERARCVSVLASLLSAAARCRTTSDGSTGGLDCSRWRPLVAAVQNISSIYVSVREGETPTSSVVQSLAPADLSRLAASLCSLLQLTASDFCSAGVQPLFSADFLCLFLPSPATSWTVCAAVDGDWLLGEWLRCLVLAGGEETAVRAPLQRLTQLLSRRTDTASVVPSPSEDWCVVPRALALNLRSLALSGRVDMVERVVGRLEYLRTWQRNGGASGCEARVCHVYHTIGQLLSVLACWLAHQKLVLIFNTLLLPPAVYDRSRSLSRAQQSAVAGSLALYSEALASVLQQTTSNAQHQQQRPFYLRCVRDLFACYLHRFCGRQSELPDEQSPLSEMVCCQAATDSSAFSRLALQQANSVFLHKKGSTYHQDLAQYVHLLLHCVRASSHVQLPLIVAQEVGASLLECLLSVQAPNVKRACTDLLAALYGHASGGVTDALSAAVDALTERHLALNAAPVMRVLLVMCVLAPSVMRHQLPALQAVVSRVELKRGVGRDLTLRDGLRQICERLGAPTIAADDT